MFSHLVEDYENGTALPLLMILVMIKERRRITAQCIIYKLCLSRYQLIFIIVVVFDHYPKQCCLANENRAAISPMILYFEIVL